MFDTQEELISFVEGYRSGLSKLAAHHGGLPVHLHTLSPEAQVQLLKEAGVFDALRNSRFGSLFGGGARGAAAPQVLPAPATGRPNSFGLPVAVSRGPTGPVAPSSSSPAPLTRGRQHFNSPANMAAGDRPSLPGGPHPLAQTSESMIGGRKSNLFGDAGVQPQGAPGAGGGARMAPATPAPAAGNAHAPGGASPLFGTPGQMPNAHASAQATLGSMAQPANQNRMPAMTPPLRRAA